MKTNMPIPEVLLDKAPIATALKDLKKHRDALVKRQATLVKHGYNAHDDRIVRIQSLNAAIAALEALA